MPRWRMAFGVLAVAAYALVAHLLMLHAGDRPWAVAALLGPLLLTALAVAWRRRHVLGLALAVLASVAVVVVVALGGVGDVNRLYLLQHVAIHLLLGASFAISLRAGRPALITALAQRVHRCLTPEMVAYTRRVTAVWAIYGCAMALISLLLFATAPFDRWSLFANLGTPLALVAMFVGEYLLRYRLHPEFERARLVDSFFAYRRSDERALPTDVPGGAAGR